MTKPIVLVVDDEPNVVHLCQRLLERINYQVITASDASHAIEILFNRPVDLLIADIRMPGLDGLQLISQARRHLPDLVAIIMTGYGTLEIAISALQKGADGLIIKPFSGADFIQNTERALEERRRRKELLRLQALQPLLEVSETLFPLRDQELLSTTLVKLIHKILKNDFTALLSQISPDTSRDGRSKNEPIWNIFESLGEIYGEGDAPVEVQVNKITANLPFEPLLLASTLDVNPALQEVLTSLGQVSLLFIPIPEKEQRLAILALRRAQMEEYSQADLEMLVVLARQSAVAFDNAQLYTHLMNSLKQVELSQNALLQAERLASAGRLTASIAHEINNPLQALQNCLELVARTGLDKDQRQKYLGLAISELNRLMSTVERMLAFYRPIARDRKRANLNAVIHRAVDLLRPQFEESSIEVHLHLDPQPLIIMAVPAQIQQVLFNLLINAMEAMPNGGDIWITSRRAPEAQNKTVEIIIEDNGPGIHGEQLERLFEPLVSNKPNGTGLGLAVSYGIVEAHGGSLQLLTGRYQGACFQIILPEE